MEPTSGARPVPRWSQPVEGALMPPVFIWLYFLLAPAGAILLLVQTARRALRVTQHRPTTIAVGAATFLLWVGASWAMGLMTFVTAYGVAHLRPVPIGHFPEGWEIYAMLALYTGLGVGLVVLTSTFPRGRTAA